MTRRDDRPVWYASYGSNCRAARFHCYLAGGPVPGSPRIEDGARDSTLPVAVAPVEFNQQVCFTGASSVWGGAPAFLEHRPAPKGALGVRYLITFGQLDDVVAQESRRPTTPLPIEELTEEGTRITIGTAAYDGLLALAPVDDVPVVTFTAPSPPERSEPAAPAGSYLATIMNGLVDVHELSLDEVVERLVIAPGVSPTWDEMGMKALVDARN